MNSDKFATLFPLGSHLWREPMPADVRGGVLILEERI